MAEAKTSLLDGVELKRLFEAAVAHLEAASPAIDAINVYPVPDGDTGSNMSATLREAVAAGTALDDSAGAGEVIGAIAKGGLFSARGNSGVILSQALRGMAEGTDGIEALDARGLADGLARAAERAYGAVAEPKEGTMLTVLRKAGEAATSTAGELTEAGKGQACLDVLEAAIAAAEEAEEHTIEQLPALQEAGVTDSGGEGICTILRGLRAGFLGEPVPEAPPNLGRPLLLDGENGHDDAFGFCTEFLLEREEQDIDLDRLREELKQTANRSVVIVGDPQLVRVHVHTDDPDALLAEARGRGRVRRVKVDDMSAQAKRFRERGEGTTAKVAALALSRGAGFDEVFESLGAFVTDLGETVKPAAGDIARAADELRVPDVIVLPNHKNVLMAAEQAVEIADATLHIVPSKTLAEGIAALLAFDPEGSPAKTVEAMAGAMQAIHSVEVTVASAARTAEGIAIEEGDALALVDTTLVARADTQEEALIEGLRHGGAADAELLTVYAGADVSADTEALEGMISDAFPGVELEIIQGGQPLYGYVASIE